MSADAYFYDHRAEIEAEVIEEDRLYEDLKAKQPSLIDQIRQQKAAPDRP
jgi:hypothetical protein